MAMTGPWRGQHGCRMLSLISQSGAGVLPATCSPSPAALGGAVQRAGVPTGRRYGSNIPEAGFFSEGTKEREGLLFNESPPAPGKSRRWESWEPIWYTTMAACVVILGVGLSVKPETSVHVKAREEMLRRQRAGSA